MSAPVRIEARAWGDIRFATLARLLGLADSDHALIKVARLWSWQTEHFDAARPTYVLDADTIESVLGPRGPAALVRARLATEVAGGYRLHGTEGQIEWCEDLSSTRQLAGRARAAGARRDARGRLLPRDSGEHDYKSPAGAPAPIQHPSSGSPAQSSAPSPSPSPEDQNSPSARAIPPSTEPAPPPTTPPPAPAVTAVSTAVSPPPAIREDIARTQQVDEIRHVAGDLVHRPTTNRVGEIGQIAPAVVHRDPKPSNVIPRAVTRAELVESLAGPYNADDPRARGRLAETTWRRVSDARLAVAADLKLPEPLPLDPITPATRPRGFDELSTRIREAGALAPEVCDRVVANLVKQARAKRSIEWLAEKAFGDKAWPNARDGIDPSARSAAGRGDQRATQPSMPTPPKFARTADPVLSPEDRAAIAAMAAGAAMAPERGREISALPTAELVKRFGDPDARAGPGSASPMNSDPDDTPDEKPRRRKAST